MLVLLWASLSMIFKDFAGTCLVVAESRNRPVLAGMFDALGDLALILVTLLGAGEVIIHGWTVHSIEVIIVICVTSAIGTIVWTRVANKLMPANNGN